MSSDEYPGTSVLVLMGLLAVSVFSLAMAGIAGRGELEERIEFLERQRMELRELRAENAQLHSVVRRAEPYLVQLAELLRKEAQ